MGFDWEEILGDTDYEDAVDMAVEALEKMQDDESVDETETLENEEEVAGAEANTSCAENKNASEEQTQTKPATTGAGFMDGMSDEPVFD